MIYTIEVQSKGPQNPEFLSNSKDNLRKTNIFCVVLAQCKVVNAVTAALSDESRLHKVAVCVCVCER